jgi:hypothetical protein
MPDNFIEIHRALIISLAARNNVPAVYQTPIIARDGGLLSYGADFQDIFHRSAHYVDNILRGRKAVRAPVQLPTKYLMVVNLKTAKALGLTVPPTLLATADEVIEQRRSRSTYGTERRNILPANRRVWRTTDMRDARARPSTTRLIRGRHRCFAEGPPQSPSSLLNCIARS